MDINQLDNELQKQKNNISILQECLKNINNYIQNMDYLDDPKDITELLEQVKLNLDSCKSNVNTIALLKSHYYDFKSGTLNSIESDTYNQLLNNYAQSITGSSNSLNNFLIKYLQNPSLKIDVMNQNIIKNKLQESNINLNLIQHTEPTPKFYYPYEHQEEKPIEKTNAEYFEDSPSNKYEDFNDLHDNNVLLISEKKNRIFLPYTVKEVTDILESSSKYHSASQVINKVFTVPLDKHKNGIISRFKETYNFMRKKEKASIMDSLDYSLDLAFNYKLNPAIILACKDLEQLDTYLDCLELNELSKFDCFKIEYEISPTKR